MSINTHPTTALTIGLTVTFSRPETPGSNSFEVLTTALISYQKMLLEQALDSETDEELKPNLVQDVMTTNGLLSELLTDGFREIFNLSFYGLK